MGCGSSSNKNLLNTLIEDINISTDKIKILIENFQNFNFRDQKSILKIIQAFFDTIEVIENNHNPPENQNQPEPNPANPANPANPLDNVNNVNN